MTRTAPVVVVGAGVIGLTTAIRLLERAHPVRIVARELPPHTTSDVAAAVWYPYLAEPRSRVLPWSRATREALQRIAAADGSAGVDQVRLLELFADTAEPPWWGSALPGFAWADPSDLPAGYGAAYDLRVPRIDTPVHMPWLLERVRALGGRLQRAAIGSLDDLLTGGAVVVNCAGLEAGALAGDPTVQPIRGQVLRLAPVPGVTTALVDEGNPLGITYVIPRSRDIVVGGTAERGDGRSVPDPETAAAILDRAVRLEPRLAGAPVLGHAVGLRPGRPAVRLESEPHERGVIVHNYGHGGSGFTLCWACADEAADLVEGVLADG
ncbi:MAG TPA: FAD-dependent oxidoreductase [Longimicrobiales bacterium]|nr:FAD-dependent oxidoreductase [Longimicrobiales bacterium]